VMPRNHGSASAPGPTCTPARVMRRTFIQVQVSRDLMWAATCTLSLRLHAVCMIHTGKGAQVVWGLPLCTVVLGVSTPPAWAGCPRGLAPWGPDQLPGAERRPVARAPLGPCPQAPSRLATAQRRHWDTRTCRPSRSCTPRAAMAVSAGNCRVSFKCRACHLAMQLQAPHAPTKGGGLGGLGDSLMMDPITNHCSLNEVSRGWGEQCVPVQLAVSRQGQGQLGAHGHRSAGWVGGGGQGGRDNQAGASSRLEFVALVRWAAGGSRHLTGSPHAREAPIRKDMPVEEVPRSRGVMLIQ
jgi:hypothetical protein